MADNRVRVLALEATSPKIKTLPVSEKKHEEHWNILEIRQGQDIREEILTYFRNKTKSSENSDGYAQIGGIMSATGIIFPPAEDSAASNKSSCFINSIGGTFNISEDGQVEQSGPLTVSYFDSSRNVVGSLVNGPLIAAGPVQIVVASCSRNSK